MPGAIRFSRRRCARAVEARHRGDAHARAEHRATDPRAGHPPLDWTVGLAARLMDAARTGRSAVDRRVRTTPQLGPLSGLERCFEVEYTATSDAVAAGFRDITADLEAAAAQTSEARRSEALARFLSTAVDPGVDRRRCWRTTTWSVTSSVGRCAGWAMP